MRGASGGTFEAFLIYWSQWDSPMIRSRRRGLIALLLFTWQASVLTPGSVAALEAESWNFGESQRVAQATMPNAMEIPPDVQGWFDEMVVQADKGNGAEALRMHERVMAWVQANLPEKHVFRARVMVMYGYLLNSMGKSQEALVPTQDGAQILRGLLKNSKEPQNEAEITRQFLVMALMVLGDIHAEYHKPNLALYAYKEALFNYQELLKEDPTVQGDMVNVQIALAITHAKLEQKPQAQAMLQKTLSILRASDKSDPDQLNSLIDSLARIQDAYAELGQSQQALDISQERLSVLRESAEFDPEQNEPFTDSLIAIAEHFAIQSETKKSEPLYREALIVLEKNLPDLREAAKADPAKREVLAKSLGKLSKSRLGLGQSNQALAPAQEAVKTYRILAEIDPDKREELTQALLDLAEISYQLRQFENALARTQEAVKEARSLVATRPKKRTVLASALVALDDRQSQLGRSSQRLIAVQEAVKIFREDAKNDPQSLESLASTLLFNQANTNSELGKLQDALAAAEEGVQTVRKMPNHISKKLLLPMGLAMLTLIHAQLGQFKEASLTGHEALQLTKGLEKSFLLRGELSAIVLVALGYQYSLAGKRQQALATTKEAMSLRREHQTLNDRLQVLYSLTLGMTAYHYTNLGQQEEALSAALESIDALRILSAKDPSHKETLASSLDTLALIKYRMGQHNDVLRISDESLKIYQERAQSNSAIMSDAAPLLSLAGQAHQALGHSKKALESLSLAIKLLREPSITDVTMRIELARALYITGYVFLTDGQPNQAIVFAREALETSRELAKGTHEILDLLSASATLVALLSLRQGQPVTAIPLLREAVSSEVRFLQEQLPLMPEGRRQALVDTLGRRWEIPYSLALQGEAGASVALYTRLNRRGPLQDIERRQALISRSSGATQTLTTRLSILNGQISNPTLSVQARQNALAESERLQEELHRQLPALQPRLVEIAEVARQLPADGVLLEFQRFSPYNAAKPEKEAWGKPRYMALVLDRRGSVRAVDLGEADGLDQTIASALDRTRLQQPGADRAWALVAEKVFSPLRGTLEGKRQLLVSPDGQLHRVPFSALAVLAGNSPTLPTTLTLQTIDSGRDLVPIAGKVPPTTAPVVIANPATIGWAPLVRAANEGQSVASTLGAQLYLGKAATVALLERTRGPRILHVAGHGYFDPQASGDPLLASGLALAGADKARQPSKPPKPSATGASSAPEALPTDDGYLTAKEAARLQLDGTTLVVLSACESGLGSERTGEGLFGLRRALTVAGARGTLLSLWKVPEHASETFMNRFYAQLRQGIPPAEAVRRVQAEFRAQPRIDGWSDPFYWAGWQYSGLPDPTP